VLTIGNFDGLHVGHRQILRTVTERASALGGESVVYTFDPHPRKVLQPDRAPSMLTTTEQKLELLEAAGIAVVVLEPFTHAFATIPPDTFVRENLHARIAPLEVYVGYDFRFGRDREGSMRLLTELGPRLGFAVTIIPEVTIDGEDVNSSPHVLAALRIVRRCGEQRMGPAFGPRGDLAMELLDRRPELRRIVADFIERRQREGAIGGGVLQAFGRDGNIHLAAVFAAGAAFHHAFGAQFFY